MPNLQRYPWNLYLINDMEDIVVFLGLKLFNSDNINMFSCSRNAQVTFIEKLSAWKVIKIETFLYWIRQAFYSVYSEGSFRSQLVQGGRGGCSQGFGVKWENLSDLLWKVLKKWYFKTENWKKGSATPFLLSLYRNLSPSSRVAII